MITEFQGKYRFLSNFWRVDIEVEGVKFDSVESAYVAHKTNDKSLWPKIASMLPGDAKRFGRTLEIRED